MSDFADLQKRFCSALILGFLFVATLYLGVFAFGALVATLAGLSLRELFLIARKTTNASKTKQYAHFSPLHIAVALAIIVSAGTLIFVFQNFGKIWLVVFILIICASDTGAYFGGRLIGGPKLWPTLSPNKTWAGAICAVIVASLVGIISIYAFDFTPFILYIAAPLSVVAQLGDLVESTLKRQAEVKDSSDMLPGHGGILDRFDSMICASLLLGLVLVLFQ